MTNTWLCGNILRVFVKSVVTGKKIDVSTPCRTTSTCMRALHADISFYFCGCGGGADLLLTHTTDFTGKDRLLIVLDLPDGVLFSNYSLRTRTLYFRCV